jgi:uncharacterized membrane protein YeaQ/YmgE (transglycosylase-associated protein family)
VQPAFLADDSTGDRQFKGSRTHESRFIFLLFFVVGLVAGWLGSRLVKGHSSGVIENLVIGVIGALIGGYVFGSVGVSTGGLVGEIIAATVGSIILLFLLRLIRR